MTTIFDAIYLITSVFIVVFTLFVAYFYYRSYKIIVPRNELFLSLTLLLVSLSLRYILSLLGYLTYMNAVVPTLLTIAYLLTNIILLTALTFFIKHSFTIHKEVTNETKKI